MFVSKMRRDYETSDRTFKAPPVKIQVIDHFDLKKEEAENNDEHSA